MMDCCEGKCVDHKNVIEDYILGIRHRLIGMHELSQETMNEANRLFEFLRNNEVPTEGKIKLLKFKIKLLSYVNNLQKSMGKDINKLAHENIGIEGLILFKIMTLPNRIRDYFRFFRYIF